MKVYLLGGFLGAGKTTLARALAVYLRECGERVAIVTNDQGRSLVDTELCRRAANDVREIVGGCFCCRYEELEQALLAAADGGATVAIAEAVGSCTDLVATVIAPLADRQPRRFDLAPLAIVVDPGRVAEVTEGRVPDHVAYLFRKQIEEADVVLLTRADLGPPDVSSWIRTLQPDACIVPVSGTTGQGVSTWIESRPNRSSSPLVIDYDRYAAAEATLAWANARVRLMAASPFSPQTALERFLNEMRDLPVAHLKVTSIEPPGGSAALIRRGSRGDVDPSGLPEELLHARWIVNARAAMAPEELEGSIKCAMGEAVPAVDVQWEHFECFRPARPIPTYRYASRSVAADETACCAAFYQRAEVRYLLGRSFHPGGVELTLRTAQRLGLRAGRRVLDVACGNGASLRAIVDAFAVEGVGLDVELHEGREERLALVRGDAHAIPFLSASFDAVICECALSTFANQAEALREMKRVLHYGGRLAVSDMVVEGTLPESLREWIHAGTCLSRAMSLRGYADALTRAGLRVVDQWDASDALREMLARVKRNLVGAGFAAATGNLPAEVRIDIKAARDIVREAERALRDRIVGYGVLIAERE
jgi:G3E family GTPase/ubiquinone/menaquinone biosynthesis C-methylase UbiE